MSDTGTDLGEMTVTRIFDAPVELVFACMTTPEHLTHFWGPTGVSTPLANITLEPRVGGVFETIMVNDDNGETYPMRGVFTEFDPPRRLAWTEPGPSGAMTSTSTFTDLGDGRTEVVIHQTNLPAHFLTPESRAGFESSLDRFAVYLATQP